MKSGCLGNIVFAVLAVIAFGLRPYVWFAWFIRGKSVSTPNLIGKSITDAKAICSDLGVNLLVDSERRRNTDRIPAGNIAWQNRTPGTTNLIKRGTTIQVHLSSAPLVFRVPAFRLRRACPPGLRLGHQD